MPRRNEIEKRGLQKQILELTLLNKTEQEIADSLCISQSMVSRYLAKNGGLPAKRIKTVKRAARIELSMEIAKDKLSEQMGEFERNYYNAMKRDDEKAAYGWSQRWSDTMEKILKVTGLYSEKPKDEDKTVKIIFEDA